MRVSRTLTLYLIRTYVGYVLLALLILLGLIYLFDTVELLRRASSKEDVPLMIVLKMGLFKLPEVGQLVFPFAILFSAIFTFWQLARRHELTVMRSAGYSVWQFLAPVVGVAVFIGCLNLGVISPISAVLLKRFETLENQYLSHRRSFVTLLREGLWLRQIQDDGYVIIHSGSIDLSSWTLRNVMVLFFDNEDEPGLRIDAETARLSAAEEKWHFNNAVMNDPDGSTEQAQLVVFPTELKPHDLEESFSSPETLSFWQLPGFIKTMEMTGFDSTRLRIHFHSLLAQPLFFAAMIFLAASVSLKPPRFSRTLSQIMIGVGISFVIFFMSSFLQALGVSHQIPVFLAAWTPALVTLLFGMTIMLRHEDG